MVKFFYFRCFIPENDIWHGSHFRRGDHFSHNFGDGFCFCKRTRKQREEEVFPPGPWSLPIVENLLQLGDHPYFTFMEMRKKCGDVFLIKLGMVPVLVVNGMEMVKEVLLRNGEHFAAWPNVYTFSFLAQWKSLTFSIMGRIGHFIRKLLPMLYEHFLKQKQNPPPGLAYLRNMSSRKSLSW